MGLYSWSLETDEAMPETQHLFQFLLLFVALYNLGRNGESCLPLRRLRYVSWESWDNSRAPSYLALRLQQLPCLRDGQDSQEQRCGLVVFPQRPEGRFCP